MAGAVVESERGTDVTDERAVRVIFDVESSEKWAVRNMAFW